MRYVVLLIGATLAACAAPAVYFVRSDGRPISADPQLSAQFDLDLTICRGEMAKADAVAADARRIQIDDDVMRGCMAQRGYVDRDAARR